MSLPVLFGAYTRTGNLKKAVWTIVGTDFNRDTSITPHCVAFFTEKQGVKRMMMKEDAVTVVLAMARDMGSDIGRLDVSLVQRVMYE